MTALRTHDLLLRGVRVHYAEAGEGPALLLVHGFLVHHGEWLGLVERLAKNFRVILPDLPGFGASEKPSRYAYTREAFAETLCDLLAGLDLPRAHIAGHSLGGAIALTLAADHPESIQKLVVLDSLAYPFELPLKGRLPLVPVLGPLVFKQLYGRTLFRAYFRDDVYAPGFRCDAARIDAFFDAFDPPEARESAYRTLLNTVDVSALGPKIPKVRAPTLVLWGEHDRIFPLALGARLAHEIPGSRFQVIPGAGHAPNEERAEATAILLERFLLES